METFDIYYSNKIKVATVCADSYEDAFCKAVGNYFHKEVTESDFYDIIVSGPAGKRYFWVRFG